MCSQTPCEYARAATGAPITRYCFQPKQTTVPATTTKVPTLVTVNPSVVTVSTVTIPNGTLLDTDKDGIPDIHDNCPHIANPDQKDTDPGLSVCGLEGDGPGVTPLPCTKMPDGDGIGDVCDNCPQVVNKDQKDTDGDGLGDKCDNFHKVANKDQKDIDADTVGDLCDNCPSIANKDQKDLDGNGSGDACQSQCSMTVNNVAAFSWTNWRGINWLTSVKDQGQCASCYSEAPMGVLEAKYNIEKGGQQNLDVSEQTVVSPCYTSPDPGSCLGGSQGTVMSDLKSSGVPDESVFPYQSLNVVHSVGDHLECNAGVGAHCSIPNSCNIGTLAPDRLWKLTSYGDSSGSVSTVKQQLLCKGPLAVCSGKWWHCVVLTGWDNSVNGGSWEIKNSWGTGWENGGYGWIRFSGEDYSEIRNDATFVSGVYHV